MIERARHRVASILVGLLVAATVRAEPPPADPREARRLYAEGARLYESHDYAGAVNAFERAYALTHAPALLFNLAQAYRLLGPAHCRAALDHYEQYLEKEPDSPDRAEVRVHIADMRACASSSEIAPKPSETSAPRPTAALLVAPVPVASAAAPSRLPTSAIVLGSVGVVGLAAFGTLALLGRSSEKDLEQGCAPRCDPADVDAMRAKYMAANVALAVAVVAIGATTYVVITREPSASASRASSLPGGGWIGVRGSF